PFRNARFASSARLVPRLGLPSTNSSVPSAPSPRRMLRPPRGVRRMTDQTASLNLLKMITPPVGFVAVLIDIELPGNESARFGRGRSCRRACVARAAAAGDSRFRRLIFLVDRVNAVLHAFTHGRDD